jgi:hypothetical protein
MKRTVPFRVKIERPPEGVVMKVQKGKAELLDPVAADPTLTFEFELTVDLSGERPNFLGRFAHGPKDARFVYVNSGSYAGQRGTVWNRRAKLSLMTISKEMVEAAIASKTTRIQSTINGTGTDGGPVCASVKGLEWKVVKG